MHAVLGGQRSIALLANSVPLSTVIDPGAPRRTTILSRAIATFSPLRALSANSARELIDDRQHANPASVRQPLRDEIHAPLLVGTRCLSERNALPLRPFSSFLRTHDQSLLEVQPVDPLCVHRPALALE